MAIECNQIANVAAELQQRFESCAQLSAEDMDLLVDLILAVQDCTDANLVQDNLFEEIALPGYNNERNEGTEDQVAALINALPAFNIAEVRLPIFTVTRNGNIILGQQGSINFPVKELWVLNELGKDDYGVGGTQVTGSDLKLLNPVQAETTRNTGVINNSLTYNSILNGQIIPNGGLEFQSTDIDYVFNGILRTVDATNPITLSPSDLTNPRIDVFAIDITTDSIVIVEGTPAGSPQEPTIDYETQLKITTAIVNAATNDTADWDCEDIYAENAGEPNEWTMVTEAPSGATVDFADVTDPNTTNGGIFAIGVKNVLNTEGFSAYNDSSITLSTIVGVKFYVKNSDFVTDFGIKVSLRDNGADETVAVAYVTDTNYGFDLTNTSTYHEVVVPIDAFTVYNTNLVDEVEITLSNIDFPTALNANLILFDDIELCTGTGIFIPIDVPNLQEVTDVGNITTNSILTPQVGSDETQAEWYHLDKDYFTMGDLGNGYGGLYNKYVSFFDANNWGHDEAIDLFINAGSGDISAFYMDAQANTLVAYAGSNGSARGQLRIGSGVIQLDQTTSNKVGTFNFEAPVVSSHIYSIPARTDAATTSHLAIGATNGVDPEVYANSEGVIDISGIASPGGAFEVLDEGNGDGIVILDRDAADYGNIGLGAFDASSSNGGSPYGATGNYSTATGIDATASGLSAIAMGNGVTASGDYSVSIGRNMAITGLYAVGLGSITGTASGDHSFITGQDQTVSGDMAAALNVGNYARSYGELAVGLFGTDYTPSDATAWSATDRAFNVGIGQNKSTQEDAFTVLKDGRVGVNIDNFETTVQLDQLQVGGTVYSSGYKVVSGTSDDIVIADGSTTSLSDITTAIEGTGTIIDLSKTIPSLYNMGLASGSASFTYINNVAGGQAQVLVNRASAPTVTGATLVAGYEFIPSVDMYLNIRDNGNVVQYNFTPVSTVLGVNKLPTYTVATLPSGSAGDTAFVTDATAPTYLAALTGGGAVGCPVVHDGTQWVSH